MEGFIERHAGHVDELGRHLVVKNGRLPAREILTGAGPVELKQGRVRDKSKDPDRRVGFTPSVLPAYLRRTDKIGELIPCLYLKGVWTGNFAEALQSLLDETAKGFSADVVVRLKEQWGEVYDAKYHPACECSRKDREQLLESHGDTQRW